MQTSFGQSLFIRIFNCHHCICSYPQCICKNTHKLVCLLTVAEQGPFILLLVLDKRLVDMVMIIMIIVMVMIMMMMMPMTMLTPLTMLMLMTLTLTMTMTMAMGMVMNH